ncbi:hypothetical protein ACI2KR_07980 [Pseudomonas luteola]
MALKPVEEAKFKAIAATVAALKAANLPHEAIASAIEAQVADFESSTRYRVKLHAEVQENGVSLSIIDTKRDFIRARKSGDTGQALRCKIFGVPVDIKAAKDGEYAFSNEQIIDALLELASQISKLPKEVKDAGNDDFNGKAVVETDEVEEDGNPETEEEQDASEE